MKLKRLEFAVLADIQEAVTDELKKVPGIDSVSNRNEYQEYFL
jgi:hypothetical protein